MEQSLQTSGSALHMPMQELPTAERPLDPANIREAIAVLIAQGKLAMAEEMADLAQILHPNDESVLAVSALVAETTQEWVKAFALLTRLQHLQGDAVRAETLHHQIRVLRCMGALEQALGKVREATEQFPADEALRQELESLLNVHTNPSL